MTLTRQFLAQLISEHMGIRMQEFLVPLISSVSKHESLVACTEILILLVNVDRLSNLSRLALDSLDNIAGVAVHA